MTHSVSEIQLDRSVVLLELTFDPMMYMCTGKEATPQKETEVVVRGVRVQQQQHKE